MQIHSRSKKSPFSIFNNKGASSIGNLLITIVVLLVCLAAYLFVSPYFENWKLGTMMTSIAAKASLKESPEAAKLYALEELKNQDYHFTPQQLTVIKDGKTLTMSVAYDVDVVVPLTDIAFTIAFSQNATTNN